ncbi:MAG: hypothetical protein HOM47_03410 [Euryarchaeota archaeon]|nr:hypothetical protein [Euryarchaeota archaeon]
MGPPPVDPIRQAFFIAFLMLLTPWAAADIATWEGPISSPDSSGLSPSNSSYDGFTLPTNHTITDSSFELSPEWTESEDNGTYWAADSPGGFSVGSSNGTSYLTSSGELTLAPVSSYGQMTDFESNSPQFSTWSPHGDPVWMPVNLSNVTYGPSNTTSGNMVAGSNGTIIPGSEGYIRSQFWPIPNVVRYFNVSFDRWNSFDSDDESKVQYSINNGQNWQTLDNWSGVTADWVSESYPLDSIVGNANSIGFRYFIKTSNSSSNDVGLFIDSFNLSNQGEPLGTWFHGNTSGEYSANADGSLIVPIDISGLNGPLEFMYWANWDIEAGNHDNLVVMISLDNNSTWTIMSPLPGVPGLGVPSGGATFVQQTYGWREVQHPFPSWAVGHVNASSALLKFRVTTDGNKNYGGSAIDGWEGIMIDDLRVLSGVGLPSMQTRMLANFTNQSGQTLVSVQGNANEWQYATWEGHNGPWSATDSFEEVQALPTGWRIDHERGATPWEIGQISTNSGYGPNSTMWPSGSKGMGINLDGVYSNDVYTHLVSPIYHIPLGSTARLTFNHWICTEAAWDGGSIYSSIDDGITWQHFGGNISGFYERLSQVNTNSPFHGKGIFDGSTVNGGCGNSNSNQTFNRVSGDISSLAGNDVRIRFSFFSDQYLEEDGWYIDDAGIEIDRFQMNGTWISPVIDADESGWARLSSLYWQPDETNITVDVLDINDNVIAGHEDLQLPFDLNIAAWQYPQLKFRVELSTENETITPRIKIIHHGITEYFTFDLLKQTNPTMPDWVTDPSLAPTNSLKYSVMINLPSWRPYSDIRVDCDGNASASIHPILHRVPILGPGYPVSGGGGMPTAMDEKECGEVLENSFGPAQAITLHLDIEVGETFGWFKLEPITLRAPIDPEIDIGDDGIVDWKWNGTFHHTTELYSLEIDNIVTPISQLGGFVTNYSNNLKFSILMPARNLSTDSWDCGANFHCYNGGLNFLTNGSQIAMMSEEQIWINNSGFSHYMVEYQFSFTTNHITSFSLLSINYISGFNHSININNSLTEQLVMNGDGSSTLPVNIRVQRGGIIFNGEIIHEKSIIDTWVSLPNDTFRPGYIQQATSNHQILENSPALAAVNLKISTTPQISGTVAEVTIDNLENGGRFIQNSGAGVLSLDTTNSSWDGENVTWSLESKWLLDDNQRLYWFATGINSDGFSLGPIMGLSGSGQYAASTNDLEVIALKAWSNNRSLHDIGNPLWPLNVKASDEIVISGEVRFSGLAGINPLSQDVDVEISLSEDSDVLSSTTINIDGNGQFNTTIYSPNLETLSGQELTISPRLMNIGQQSSTANDATSYAQEIKFIFDTGNAEIISLEINAPGGNQPADGHVWHPGQDIPLQLNIADDNGLPSKMELFYNRSGRGWESIDFLTPVGATSAIIDLPLIDESSVPLSNEEKGWLDVFIQGTDLAGNPIVTGGNMNEPYATIFVQPRYATWISGDSIGLDRVDDYLLPGNTHRFNFTLSDDNGIESIDLVRIDMAKNKDWCAIEWMPWSNEIIHDVGCFIKPPKIEHNQHWQTNTWDVTVDFELRWDLEEDIGSDENIPALKLWDENAPLGAAFTAINHLSWMIHSGIDLRVVDVEDKVAPLGSFNDKIIYIHAQDIIDIEVIAYHMGYDIPVNNMPFSTTYLMQLFGDLGSSETVNSFNSDGSSTSREVLDSAFYGSQIKVVVNLNSIFGHSVTGDSIDIVIDDSIPTISISSGSLVSIDSDKLGEVPVEVTIQDGHGLDTDSVNMHWTFIRQGRLIENSGGTISIPIQFESVRSNLYSGIIDMDTSPDLQKGDSIFIWFDGKDASGREIQGNGTSAVDPIHTLIRWIAYEPVLDEIITTPYRPNVGDIITIECLLSNTGLLDGNTKISLLDGDGILLEEYNLTLLVDMELSHTFEIEAWAEGDLGLKIQIDNQPPVPIPLSNVQTNSDHSSSSETVLLGLSILSVFIAGLLLITANTHRKHQATSDEEE